MMTTLSNPHELHIQLVQVVGYSKKSFVLMGKLLSELKMGEVYQQAIGEGINTWIDYISQPEIGLSKGEADRLIQIYEEFVMRLGFTEDFISSIPIKNIHYLLPIVKKHDDAMNVLELLEDAQQLSQKDFRERVYEAKNEDAERTYEFLIMRKCVETGTLSKVHDISSDQIKEKFDVE